MAPQSIHVFLFRQIRRLSVGFRIRLRSPGVAAVLVEIWQSLEKMAMLPIFEEIAVYHDLLYSVVVNHSTQELIVETAMCVVNFLDLLGDSTHETSI